MDIIRYYQHFSSYRERQGVAGSLKIPPAVHPQPLRFSWDPGGLHHPDPERSSHHPGVRQMAGQSYSVWVVFKI